MARTTQGKVVGLLRRDFDADALPDLTGFIDTASAVVDRVVNCALGKGLSLGAPTLELIERWLAAHYYTRSDLTYASNTTDGASASFHGQTGMALDASFYGQSALDLDWTGCLNAVSKRQRAGAAWLGKPPSAQIDYVDRD